MPGEPMLDSGEMKLSTSRRIMMLPVIQPLEIRPP